MSRPPSAPVSAAQWRRIVGLVCSIQFPFPLGARCMKIEMQTRARKMGPKARETAAATTTTTVSMTMQRVALMNDGHKSARQTNINHSSSRAVCALASSLTCFADWLSSILLSSDTRDIRQNGGRGERHRDRERILCIHSSFARIVCKNVTAQARPTRHNHNTGNV